MHHVGLWTSGSGSVLTPPEHTLFFLPQKPFMPLGNLREQLLFPSGMLYPDDSVLLHQLGTSLLVSRSTADYRPSESQSGERWGMHGLHIIAQLGACTSLQLAACCRFSRMHTLCIIAMLGAPTCAGSWSGGQGNRPDVLASDTQLLDLLEDVSLPGASHRHSAEQAADAT